ncbi:hypothetical protein [Butyrivibrio sp.]|uniref:hypothetical protein n=1 Tax=Butyrivibrio sp. TaxID=28121 RepID=UPI0025C0E276|nr:hypothetical protein [Butyrivibrio sp.]MBQ9303171.1 hypothetical protein [Butyrivibrio sp.]
MGRRVMMKYSHLLCPVCGTTMTIPRRADSLRIEGHIKTMYCAICANKRDFIENNYRTLDQKEALIKRAE